MAIVLQKGKNPSGKTVPEKIVVVHNRKINFVNKQSGMYPGSYTFPGPNTYPGR